MLTFPTAAALAIAMSVRRSDVRPHRVRPGARWGDNYTVSTVAAESNGDFWIPANPDVVRRGRFTAEVGEQPELMLAGRLVADSQPRTAATSGDIASIIAAHAERSVAAFQPITVWGLLDDGQAVTLLGARNHGGAYGRPPRYLGQIAVSGTHVSDNERYSAVRFRIGHPLCLAHLSDGESRIMEDDQSTLGVTALEAENWLVNWLVYESSAPATLQELEMRVVSGCRALMHVALHPDRDLPVCETQVRRDPDEPWLTLRGPAFCAEPGSFQVDTLLPADELTLERFAQWIPLNDSLDGLGWAVARGVEGPLQVQTQVLTSLVEGLHRRLDFEQSYFPREVPKAALKRIRKAAWEAAAAQARAERIEGLDPVLVGELVKKAVGHVGDVSFRDRADAVVAEVGQAVPEIATSVPELPKILTDPRHLFAHQLPQDQAKEPLEDRWRYWRAVSSITPWLLRALLLLNLGVDPHFLHQRCLCHEKFVFFRENTAELIRELGWHVPSDDG